MQTDSVVVTSSVQGQDMYHQSKGISNEEDQISSLTAADLASILKWSKEISSDINLSLALQKLTEIATGTSQSLCCGLSLISKAILQSLLAVKSLVLL